VILLFQNGAFLFLQGSDQFVVLHFLVAFLYIFENGFILFGLRLGIAVMQFERVSIFLHVVLRCLAHVIRVRFIGAGVIFMVFIVCGPVVISLDVVGFGPVFGLARIHTFLSVALNCNYKQSSLNLIISYDSLISLNLASFHYSKNITNFIYQIHQSINELKCKISRNFLELIKFIFIYLILPTWKTIIKPQ
jgi:hypothetical protein